MLPAAPLYRAKGVMRTVLSVLLGVALTLTLGLAGCGRNETEASDPFAAYRPAVREGVPDPFVEMADAPRYELSVELLPDERLLTGRGRVQVINTSPDSWSHLVFRLYPALPHYGGALTVQSAIINGRAVPIAYDAYNTALRVQLARPLTPGGAVMVDLEWKLDIRAWPDLPATYALFGSSQSMISLPLFYPSLAVYQAGPTVGTGRWWMDIGSIRGDAAFNYASLFDVTVVAPSDYIPVTSGTLVSSEPIGGRTRYRWVTGPSREFFMQFSTRFQSASVEAYGTTVTSYWLPGDEGSGRAALRHATAALRIFSDEFGPYPFRDMRVAPAPLTFRGMEYPQVNLIGVETYNRFRGDLELLIAHEVAHQWWYQVVHNDPIAAPWLDEALAEYSIKVYLEALRTEEAVEDVQNERWAVPVASLALTSGNVPVQGTVESFANARAYETIVYGKGALFYDALRQQIGDRRFRRFLRAYLNEHSFAIVDEQRWLEAVQALDEPELEQLYRDWIARPRASGLPADLPSEPTGVSTPSVGDAVESILNQTNALLPTTR